MRLVIGYATNMAGAKTQDPLMLDEELIEAAMVARDRAHVPYSNFGMGAAVRTVAGGIVRGTLIENVSLGLAMCAERIALFTTRTNGDVPAALALVAARTDGELTWPCGACLQVALELGGRDLPVLVSDLDGDTDAATLAQLLPHGPKTSHRS
jgi:cytidine deaminase